MTPKQIAKLQRVVSADKKAEMLASHAKLVAIAQDQVKDLVEKRILECQSIAHIFANADLKSLDAVQILTTLQAHYSEKANKKHDNEFYYVAKKVAVQFGFFNWSKKSQSFTMAKTEAQTAKGKASKSGKVSESDKTEAARESDAAPSVTADQVMDSILRDLKITLPKFPIAKKAEYIAKIRVILLAHDQSTKTAQAVG